MRTSIKYLVVGSLLVLGAAGCTDLVVVNENDPDATRSLASAGDVESLVAVAFNTWFQGTNSADGPAAFLSNAAFQFNPPWANFGMEQYGRIPRVPILNDSSDPDYPNFVRPWFFSYRAIAAVSDGLRALENPAIAEELGAEDVTRLQAFAYFNLGLSHATIYSDGFAVDATTDLAAEQDLLDYNALMTEALGYFDEAITLSSSASFTLPLSWMQIELTGPEIAQVAHSYKARFRAQVARTETERAAVEWDKVIADVRAGITADLVPFYDDFGGWSLDVYGLGSFPGWSQAAYFIYGMADQSGDFQRWDALSLSQKDVVFPGDEPVLIVTPDLRFPQGTTVDEQRLAKGTLIEIASVVDAGSTWQRPERGTWRWSWYLPWFGREYWGVGYPLEMNQREIDHTEMRLLEAEGLYRQSMLGEAATIINETRVAAGLNATDGAGLNTSCVPKLPDNSCGDLFEMLKWEKRLETVFVGLATAPWYFDGRGWGDLFKDTPLHLPVPCGEIQVLQILPCTTVGGPGGEMSAPVSNYAFNGEN